MRAARSPEIGSSIEDTLLMLASQADPTNPYAPPAAAPGRPEPEIEESRAAALRLRWLRHEAALRALAMTHLLGAGLDVALVGFVSTEFRPGGIWSRLDAWAWMLSLATFYFAIPALFGLHLILSRGLRRLQPWAFRIQLLLSGSSIIAFFLTWASGQSPGSFGDFLIVAAILQGIAHFAIVYCLTTSSCRRILAPDYREAVAASPHLRAQPGWPVLIGAIAFSIAAEWGLIGLAGQLARLAAMPFS